jgi:CheY-like chemotaxis protein
MSIAPILDEKGRIFNFVAIKTDTTQQMLFEKEMLRAKEKAEENDKLKSAFLANISHEIRTPLNSIMGFSELLLGGNIEPETILAFAKIIHNSGKNLMSIISNVIQLSEIQSETVFVTQTPINVVDIIISIVREYSEDFQNKNIELAFKNTTPYKQIIIDTDAYKFHQIISKFVSNSLKFTEKGKVDIILEIKSENELEITVKDTGAGIKPELQHIIFEPFIRFDTFDNDFKKGIGLGLSIANSYAKMLNGNIKINSKPGEGAEFRFLLNTKITIITEQPVEYHGIENIFSDFTIVIAEDDNNNLKLIEQILEETGVHLICTRNGRELLEMLKKVPSISLILLDLNMPVKDGLEALKEIRTFNSEIPIIAQTAYTNEIETAYELGITNCITKPIDSALLIQILKRYLL